MASISEETANQNYNMIKSIFKSMIIGSKTAKYLSMAYVGISFGLAIKYNDDIVYSITLVLGGVLMGVYALKFLWLRQINTNIDAIGQLLQHIQRYKKHTLKRQKYEQFIMVLWILTLVPAYLDGKELRMSLVIGLLVVFYIFIITGNFLFNNVKKQFEDMDDLAQHL